MCLKDYPQPMTVEEQIENLKKLHLIIQDEEDAKRKLNRVSYYRLIKAYSYSFKNRKSGIYKRGTTFDDIYQLYEFDNKLRYLLIPQFERIEITLRCRITNYFSVKYGSLGYLDSINFEGDYSDLRSRIDKSISNAEKSSPSIKHFKEEYRDNLVPLYAAIEVFSFGTLAIFYKTMKLEDRKAIANMYYKGNSYYLASWFESVVHLRNVCSHFGRIYQKVFVRLPMLFNPDESDVKNNRLFRILCCMRYLQHEYGDWSGVVADISDLLKEYEGIIKPSGLGFSDGWERKLLDQEPYRPLAAQIAKEMGLIEKIQNRELPM